MEKKYEYYWFYYTEDYESDDLAELGIVRKEKIDGTFIFGNGASYFANEDYIEYSNEGEWHANVNYIAREATKEEFDLAMSLASHIDNNPIVDACNWFKSVGEFDKIDYLLKNKKMI